MVLTKEEILRKIRINREEIKKFGVKRIWLFGSWARNEQKEDSDIDLIVEFEKNKKNFENFISLNFFLEKLFGRKVDLLTLESISPYIKPYIDKEVIYEEI